MEQYKQHRTNIWQILKHTLNIRKTYDKKWKHDNIWNKTNMKHMEHIREHMNKKYETIWNTYLNNMNTYENKQNEYETNMNK